MGLSQDFLSSGESSDEDEIKYFKPVLARRRSKKHRINNKKAKILPRKVTLEGERCQPKNAPVVDIVNAPIGDKGSLNLASKVGLADGFKADKPPEFDEAETDAPREPSKQSTERTYEYGIPINGYKFVGKRSDYEKFMKAGSSKENVHAGIDGIDPQAFDRCVKPLRSSVRSDDISIYWSESQGVTRLPTLHVPRLEEVPIDSIEKNEISQFMRQSALALKLPLRDVLKQQRIVWHPDKVSQSSPNAAKDFISKATKVFQVINSLWEEEKYQI